LSERGRWGEVEAIYRSLVEADLQNSFLGTQLGTAYVRLGLPDSAIVHYELAHALNPRSVRVVLALTKVYYDREFFLSAKRVVDRALDQRPRNPDLWRRRGEVALKEEDYRLATEAFERTIQYGDSAAKDLSKLGVSRYLSNDLAGAEEVLMRSFELDDQDVMNAFYLGLAKQQLQQFEEALTYLNHAADLIGEGLLADVQARIGNTYDQMKSYPDAIKAYRLSLSLESGRTEALFHLAAVYDAYYADKKMAQDQYERFLGQVEEGQMPQMQSYARQRVKEIKEGEFFRSRPVPPPTKLDSIVVESDTTEGGDG
jgi:tetratricopeptide (TPR) repeat protein